MKNIMKIAFVILGSFALLTSANAGALEVTGTAKATYSVAGGGTASSANNKGKAIGITNELAFTGTGELDNGFTWKYQVELDDNASGVATFDDTRLEVTTDMGTIAAYNTEGSLNVKYKASQAAYTTGTDHGSGGGMVYGDNIGVYNNVQLHTPAGLLPYDMSIKYGFSPSADQAKNSGNSGGAGSAAGEGNGAHEYQVSLTPVEGAKIFASYFQKDDEGGNFKYETGGAAITYAYGPVVFGVAASGISDSEGGSNTTKARTTARGTTRLKAYENRALSVGYAYNDALSFSFERETSDADVTNVATATRVDTDASVELQVQTIQAAYTMGGMTLALSHKDIENDDYALDKDQTETIFAVNMAF